MAASGRGRGAGGLPGRLWSVGACGLRAGGVGVRTAGQAGSDSSGGEGGGSLFVCGRSKMAAAGADGAPNRCESGDAVLRGPEVLRHGGRAPGKDAGRGRVTPVVGAIALSGGWGRARACPPARRGVRDRAPRSTFPGRGERTKPRDRPAEASPV